MIIRATNKLLKISRINAVKNDNISSQYLPGEWYASLISTGRPGSFAIHFLHNPTFITIIILGKSLNKAIPILPLRVSYLLKRHRYSALEAEFQLNSKVEIYSTNSRNVLANMNQMKYNIEYHLALAESIENIVIDRIEDIHIKYLFGGKAAQGRYVTSKDKLDQLIKNMGSR